MTATHTDVAPVIQVTTFPTTSASSAHTEAIAWDDLCARLATPQVYESKQQCPLLKLASFGSRRTAKRSLRHDDNVLQVYGVEGDYDGGQVSIDEAADRLAAVGVAAFLYTSASHTSSAPRWRVLAPLAAPGEAKDRRHYVGLLNAALGGVLAPESFVLSQTYFAGRVKGAAYATRQVKGVPLDTCLDLVVEPQFPREKPGPTDQPDDLERAIALTRVNDATMLDLRAALDATYSADDRGDWILAGQQLKCLGPAGYVLWATWSARSTKFDDGKEDPERVWEGFSGARTDYRAVFAEAQRRGWKNTAGRVAPVASSVLSADVEISFVDFASLATTPPPPRRWVVHEWLPRQTVTALFGRGGHGKSLLAQQLGITVASGLPWLGLATERGPVLGLFCEDDEGELLRRASNIFDALGLDPATDGGALHLDARAGKANVLVSVGRERLASSAPLLDALRSQCQHLRPVLVILDNASQLFAGDENSRTEVTQFCNALTAIACEFDCAVLLLGHTAKSADSEYSGSTGWDASVRARLLLERQDDGTSRLRKLKANYSDRDELRVEWRNGAFTLVPAALGATPESLSAAKPIIVEAIDRYTRRQQAVSHLPAARNNLVKLMKADGLLGGVHENLIRAALEAMLDAQEVAHTQLLPWKNTSRHPVFGLANAEKNA